MGTKSGLIHGLSANGILRVYGTDEALLVAASSGSCCEAGAVAARVINQPENAQKRG